MDRRTAVTSGAPLRPRDRRLVAVVFVVVPVVLFISWVALAYRADRFEHHAAVADARILDSDLGCIGAYGSGSSTGVGGRGSIRYEIAFPYEGRLHTTSVRRPCTVIPPDFGRGRGYIWVEYDRDHPDRVRVLGDDTARVLSQQFWAALLTVLAAEGVIVIWRWERRLASKTRHQA